MSETIQRLSVYVNGLLTDPTGSLVESEDEGDTYGVQRTDTYETVVDSGEDYVRISTGLYSLTFDEPEDDLTYRWSAKMTYDTVDYYVSGQLEAGTSDVTIVLPDTSSYYTSEAEVLRIIGAQGIELLLEDSNSRSSVWSNLLQDADDTIKMYILQHYDPALLYSNSWIRRRATKLVANLLTSRRGNPPLYTSAIDRVYEELQMIRDGKMHIPGARPRFFQGPLVRNYLMQPFSRHPMRVQEYKSTSAGTYAGQDYAVEPFVYYGVL